MRPRYRDLFKRMCDPDPLEREAAFDAVLFDRHQALPDIIEGYKRANRKAALRFDLVQLMGFSGSVDAVEPLFDALEDQDPDVRAEACRSLEDLRPAMTGALRERACGLLRPLLLCDDAVVRHAAGDALVALQGGKVIALRQGDRETGG